MPSVWSQDIYRRAFWFAARAHHSQKYPGTDLPYLLHINLVSMETMAALCFERCNGDLTIQCGLLHDVLEDTKITYSEIQAEFGDQVAKGVMALTKNTSLEKSLQMKDSLQRIQNEPREIAMVKMADRICNLDTPPHYWKQEKIIQYREEAREIYNALSSKNNYLGNRLMKKIEEYSKYIY